MGYPPAAPSTDDLCVLYGYIKKAEDSPVQGAAVRVTPSPLPEFVGSDTNVYGTGVSIQVVEATTDAQGWFEQELRRGMEVQIDVPEIGLSIQTTIPEEVSVDLAAIQLRPAPAGVLNEVS